MKQQPNHTPMDTLTVIDMPREVLLGEMRDSLPSNSAQRAKVKKKATPQSVSLSVSMPAPPTQSLAPLSLTVPAQSPARATGPSSKNNDNYVTNNKAKPAPYSKGKNPATAKKWTSTAATCPNATQHPHSIYNRANK